MNDLVLDPLSELRKIAKRFSGRLSKEDLAAAREELREVVPRGRYLGTECVEVVGIDCDEEKPAVSNFFVRLRDGRKIQLAFFLETHRRFEIHLV